MKKTFNINIAGSVFTIDDDAYALLDDYLDTLNHAFKGTDNEEIIPDIESRISEIFSVKIANGANVITLSDVEGVIARIGRPEELVDIDVEISSGQNEEEEHIGSLEETVPPPYSDNEIKDVKKKLFRDSSKGMLGGVCAGFATYLNFDVTWIRLILVCLFVFSYSSIAIVYVILWIVLPDARTPLQRMQMEGEVPTLSNIGKSVTGFFKSTQENNTSSSSQTPPPPHRTESSGKRFADGLAQVFGAIAKMILMLVMVVAVPVVVALGVALVVCIFALIEMGTAWGFTNITGSILFTNINYNEVLLGLLIGIGTIIAIGIPLYCLIWLIATGNKKSMRKGTKISLIIVWSIGFVLAAISTGLLVAYEQTAPASERNLDFLCHKDYFEDYCEDVISIESLYSSTVNHKCLTADPR